MAGANLAGKVEESAVARAAHRRILLRVRENAEAVSLGSYEKTVKGVVGRPETMVQFFGGGDACGDGAAPRRTRVDLFCGRRLMLLSVTEPDPCAYRMNVTHPLACRDGTPAFEPEPVYDPPRPR